MNNLNLKPFINKYKIYKKLHIEENTEVYKNVEQFFDNLIETLFDNMKLTTVYAAVEKFDLGISELDSCVKYIICFISSKDDISNIVNKMMSSGEYLKGYILNEMASDVIFNLSNEMNKIIKNDFIYKNFKLSKRYAAGDGEISLNYQKIILETLKKEINLDVLINENNMIMPEKSLLYLYGLYKDENIKKVTGNCNSLNEMNEEDSCFDCGNINCQYRDIK